MDTLDMSAFPLMSAVLKNDQDGRSNRIHLMPYRHHTWKR
jgi:hypothetical protein